MTATDELRRMLDERGVEYEVDDAKTVRVTRWKAYGEWVSFIEYDTGETRFCTDMRRFTPAQAIAVTLGRGTCREVYLLMATDIGNGREEVLGVYATEEAAIVAINENQFGYGFHHVRKWEVDV